MKFYPIGPFTLEEWLVNSEKVTKMFEQFARENPNLLVETETIVEDEPDFYYIIIKIDEFEDNQENSERY